MFDPSQQPRHGAPLLGLLLLPVLVLASPRSAAAQGAEDAPPLFTHGEVVGRLQLDAPEVDSFILRGMLPLPPSVHPRPSGKSPFALRGPDGQITTAQIETVSRYPTETEGSDVVELLSRVQRPSSIPPGTRIHYDVLFEPQVVQSFTPSHHQEKLLEDGVHLETRDVFGHLYGADLLLDLRTASTDLRVLRSGQFAHQVRTHEVLLPVSPVSGSTGTLEHHVAAHAYVTLWEGDEVVSIDLRVYNGGSGLDPASTLDDPNQRVYFDELVLRIPPSWRVLSAFEDPFLGDDSVQGGFRRVPLVEALPGGKLHMMPMQAQMVRRLVLYRSGHIAAARAIATEQTLAFSTRGQTEPFKASWWNPTSGTFLAQKQVLPDLGHLNVVNMALELDQRFALLEDTLATGASLPWPFPILKEVQGWAHPWGPEIGYAYGGEEINYFSGADVAYLASRSGYRTYQISHRMYNSRHATALYNGDGEPTSLENWLQPGGPTGQWNPTWVWIKPILWLGDPFGFNNAPTFQVDAVAAMGKQPDYEQQLLAYQHIDDQHLVRYTRPAKVLAWLGNDALAKDDLRMQAELVRLTFSDYPNNPNGDSIAIGMHLVQKHVDQFPGEGAHVHRATGWEIDTVATAYAIGTRNWRKRLEPWCDSIVDLLERGQDACTGVLGSNPDQNNLGGGYRLRQSISESILENALWGLRQSVYGERRPDMTERLSSILVKSGYAMISQLFWNSEHDQAHFYTALGPYDFQQPSFCTYVPPGGHGGIENYQGWPTLAYAFRLTGDGVFLTKALEMAQGNVQGIPNFGGGYLDNAVPVMALFQQLGL